MTTRDASSVIKALLCTLVHVCVVFLVAAHSVAEWLASWIVIMACERVPRVSPTVLFFLSKLIINRWVFFL